MRGYVWRDRNVHLALKSRRALHVRQRDESSLTDFAPVIVIVLVPAFFGPDTPGGRLGGGLSSRMGTAFVDRAACIDSSRTLAVCDGRTPSSFASTRGLDVLPVFFFRSALTVPVARLAPVAAFAESVPVELGSART
jgi:hypothetical protein